MVKFIMLIKTEPKRCVIVTGGANGIGEAVARGFVHEGHPVAIVDRDARGCQKMERWAANEPVPFLAVPFDITELGQHRRVVQRIHKQMGPIGVLVNAAGVGVSHSFRDTLIDEFDYVLGSNLRGPFFFTRTILQTMRKGGSIVFITSVHQDEPVGDPTYSMSKAALKVLVKELALEFAHRKIRVNGVAPGAIRHRKTVDRRFLRVPYGKRRGTPDDVAQTITFLCSQSASYITGEVVTVDGGLSLVNWIATEGMQA